MTIRPLLLRFLPAASLSMLVSCAVDENASLFRGGNSAAAVRAEAEGSGEGPRRGFFSYSRSAEKARRAEARKLAKEMSRRNAWAGDPAEAERKREGKWLSRFAGGHRAGMEGPVVGEVEIAPGRKRGGWFSGLPFFGSDRQRGDDHRIYVNHEILPYLDASNARIEISLGEQVARIYLRSGMAKDLVVETQISTGKSGYETPTGSWTIGEKLVEKKSTIYGTWHAADGTLLAHGESTRRPAGASHFVGADMPYWMRITGGIGMHIGEVPGYPASHGCIRVPSAIQPLIYSKVGLGTPVTITR